MRAEALFFYFLSAKCDKVVVTRFVMLGSEILYIGADFNGK
ncbi:hypothetical protein EMIT019CA3_180054 [Bacillus pseudomycoides]